MESANLLQSVFETRGKQWRQEHRNIQTPGMHFCQPSIPVLQCRYFLVVVNFFSSWSVHKCVDFSPSHVIFIAGADASRTYWQNHLCAIAWCRHSKGNFKTSVPKHAYRHWSQPRGAGDAYTAVFRSWGKHECYILMIKAMSSVYFFVIVPLFFLKGKKQAQFNVSFCSYLHSLSMPREEKL